MSQAVIHGDTIYLAGQLGVASGTIEEQCASALAKVDALLDASGSSKDHLLFATIWLADMADFAAMNSVWDAWIANHPAPARATGEARLATPAHKVEFMIIAAKME